MPWQTEAIARPNAGDREFCGLVAELSSARIFNAVSIETFYLMTRDDPSPARLAELSVVEVTRDVTTEEGGHVPAGSRGTIVAIWGEGEAYEVEFARPVVGLATVTASSLRAA